MPFSSETSSFTVFDQKNFSSRLLRNWIARSSLSAWVAEEKNWTRVLSIQKVTTFAPGSLSDSKYFPNFYTEFQCSNSSRHNGSCRPTSASGRTCRVVRRLIVRMQNYQMTPRSAIYRPNGGIIVVQISRRPIGVSNMGRKGHDNCVWILTLCSWPLACNKALTK